MKKEKSEAKLLLIGKGPLQNRIRNKAYRLGIDRDVVFAGQRNDVNKCYSAMDVFLFPSLYEGLGMVAIEAQVNGLKCVASKHVPKDADVGNLTYADCADSYVKAVLSKNERTSVVCPQYDIRITCRELELAYYAALTKQSAKTDEILLF